MKIINNEWNRLPFQYETTSTHLILFWGSFESSLKRRNEVGLERRDLTTRSFYSHACMSQSVDTC